MDKTSISKYLKRINFINDPSVSKECLFELQKAHLLSVPFENLDIHNNKTIVLKYELLFDKVVKNKRGGFCYELNGLFFDLLTSIGFNAQLISGRVHNKQGSYGEEFDHMAIIVTINQSEYLVDVGFGKFTLEPLLLEQQNINTDALGDFCFTQFDQSYWLINEVIKSEYHPQYKFKKIKRNLSDFEDMCNFHQTSSLSHFTKSKLISILTTDGRTTLTNTTLKQSNGRKFSIVDIGSDLDFMVKLKQHFNIEI